MSIFFLEINDMRLFSTQHSLRHNLTLTKMLARPTLFFLKLDFSSIITHFDVGLLTASATIFRIIYE